MLQSCIVLISSIVSEELLDMSALLILRTFWYLSCFLVFLYKCFLVDWNTASAFPRTAPGKGKKPQAETAELL